MSGYGIVKELGRLTGQKGRIKIKYYSTTEKGTEFLDLTRELFEMPVKEILKDFIAS